ncbi:MULTISPECIES: ABC transporter ATP-binding protein [Halorussus]|uniref:ABC transporter ATP-binding protein n=1 Tax=Halorussus TaxID=1070314 RepID=UPI00209DC5EE|nr:ABC transporter ATP-binding protein [Halorussus vallis]USZ78024.1 ABC transporter ATP-binding protein [Halorussus vallis]
MSGDADAPESASRADAPTGASARDADDPVLRVEGVTKRFGGLTAVDDVDAEIHDGEIVGLIGPNGSGKTTLFDCITGRLDPEEGSISLRGREITGRPEHRIAAAGLGRMFQHTRVYGGMSVLRNLLVAASEDRRPTRLFRPPSDAARERAEELLGQVNLWELRRMRAGRMSFGQQKLLEFAMVLMTDPDVLLMDEPAGGINPSMIRRMLDYIREANEGGLTIFLIEHNMDVVMDVSERVYVLAHGEKIAEGTPAEIQSDDRVLDAYLGRE